MKIILLLAITISFSSCATLCGGKVTTYQKNKPTEKDQARKLRPAPFILNALIFLPGIPIDLITGAAYKPKFEDGK